METSDGQSLRPTTSITTTTEATPSSIDQLTLSYLRGDISFQDYETLIENQHFLAIAASASSSMTSNASDRHSLTAVSSTIELSTLSADNSSTHFDDRFFRLKDIMDDDDQDEDDEDDEHETGTRHQSATATSSRSADAAALVIMADGEDTTLSNWNEFDIVTLNFDKFIKDHQTENKEVSKSPTKSNKRKRDVGEFVGAAAASLSAVAAAAAVRVEDPSELKAKRRGLMGEANLSYARGETNKAIDTCLEVIKYAPKAPEPFQLLSMLYAEQGQNAKSLRVGLIAAQLNKDPQEWEQLIQQAVIEGDIDLVLFCYNNAIQCDTRNIRLHVERIRVLEAKQDARRLMLAKLMLLRYVDVEQTENEDNEMFDELQQQPLSQLEIYRKYFDEVMLELRDDEAGDRAKKIYVIKNDMKKFKDKFELESKQKQQTFKIK